MRVAERRRLGGVLGVTLVSQALSAANALILNRLGLEIADTYSIAAQVGLAGFTGIVVGILYNIAIGRPGFTAWRLWAGISASASLLFAGGQLLLLSASGYLTEGNAEFVVAAVLSFGMGGSLVSVAAALGVKRACLGQPLLFAAVTVPPNLGFLLGTLVGWFFTAPLAPLVGWLSGSVVILTIAIVLPRLPGPARVSPLDGSSDALGTHVVGLVLGVISSTVLPLFYVAAVAQLAQGTVYIATLVARIGNATVSLLVNSVLLVRYQWDRERTFERRIPIALGLAYCVLSLTGLLGDYLLPTGLWSIAVILGWLCLLVGGAVTIREMNAGRRGRAVLIKASLEVLLTTGVAYVLFARPSLGGYFGAFNVSQALSIVVGGATLKDIRMTCIGGASMVCALAVVALG